jgi:hypothetical protein
MRRKQIHPALAAVEQEIEVAVHVGVDPVHAAEEHLVERDPAVDGHSAVVAPQDRAVDLRDWP